MCGIAGIVDLEDEVPLLVLHDLQPPGVVVRSPYLDGSRDDEVRAPDLVEEPVDPLEAMLGRELTHLAREAHVALAIEPVYDFKHVHIGIKKVPFADQKGIEVLPVPLIKLLEHLLPGAGWQILEDVIVGRDDGGTRNSTTSTPTHVRFGRSSEKADGRGQRKGGKHPDRARLGRRLIRQVIEPQRYRESDDRG